MSDHTVRAFDEDLGRLSQLTAKMGDLACRQLEEAFNSIEGSDGGVAARLIEREPEADRMEHEIEGFAIRMLALRQPMARDLREVVAALRIANELERICDYAADLAERTIAMRSIECIPLRSLGDIGRFALKMVKDALGAYSDGDILLADDVWNRDRALDEMYTSLYRELLTYMIEDPGRISAGTQMLFMARAIERVGDRATNIAEIVRYLVSGIATEEERVKADATKSIVSARPR